MKAITLLTILALVIAANSMTTAAHQMYGAASQCVYNGIKYELQGFQHSQTHSQSHQQDCCRLAPTRPPEPHQPDHDWYRHHHLGRDQNLLRNSQPQLHCPRRLHHRPRPGLPQHPLEILRPPQRLHVIASIHQQNSLFELNKLNKIYSCQIGIHGQPFFHHKEFWQLIIRFFMSQLTHKIEILLSCFVQQTALTL